MNNEENLIPYHAAPLPQGPYLILAPHPDDETLGMGGTIARAVKQNIAVTILFVTDGAVAGEKQIRREEARKAADILGVQQLIFGDVPDRQVAANNFIKENLPETVRKTCPRSIFLPSILEYHPDHRAVTAQALQALEKEKYAGEIFLYEITRQSEINTLIDITPVIETKIKAILAYKSQITQRPYQEISLSINKARTLTLFGNEKYAEGFWRLQNLNLHQSLHQKTQSYITGIPNISELVSIIVRTRNRPDLLEHAIRSIATQTYNNIETVIVNDGGCAIDENRIADMLQGRQVRYIELKTCRGRAAAANIGINNSSGVYTGFLDDDDEFYNDHVANLVSVMQQNDDCDAAYSATDVIEIKRDNQKTVRQKLFIFGREFDYNELLLNNYIPIISVIFRSSFLKKYSFDESFDLYEDWDLLIRAASDGHFCFLNKTTACYNQWDSSQITIQSSKETVKKATTRIYEKHRNMFPMDKIVELRDELNKQHREISEKDEQLNNMNRHCEQLQNSLQEKNEYISAIHNSKFWKLRCKYARLKSLLMPF